MFWVLPVNSRKVLFLSDTRDHLSPNFKFVNEELARRFPQVESWSLLKPPWVLKKTVKEHIQLAYHLATAKVILLDDVYNMIYFLKLRKNVELVQLWHAVGAFKTFGYSRVGRPGGPSLKSVAHRNYTKAIVSSKSIARHYAEGFGISEDKIVATGVPRTDVFFQPEYRKDAVEKVYRSFPQLIHKRVILYAPTFRGHGATSAYFPADVLDLNRLAQEVLTDGCILLVKQHPFIKQPLQIPNSLREVIFDVTTYPDVNDLLFITDLLITDYSSVCFEAALLKIPMLFYAFDLEEYVSSRDFYYSYETFVPGTIVRNMQELITAIENHNFDFEKQEAFVKHFFDATDGRSTERVVDMLLQYLE